LEIILRLLQQHYRWLDLLAMLGVALLYALLAKIVLAYFSETDNITLIWFPGGLALAVLLSRGKQYWPAIFAGAFAAGLMVNDPIPTSLAIALGNTLESVVAAWLLNHNPRFSIALSHIRDYIWLTFTGMIAALISAALGPCSLWLGGTTPGDVLPAVMLRWWMSDAFGIITLTPILLIWRNWPRRWFSDKRVPEALLLAGLSTFVGQVLFLDAFHPTLGKIAHGYWMFLFAIWGAMRFGRHGVMLITLLIMTQALFGAAHHRGYFGDDFEKTRLLNLWFYLLIMYWTGTILALTRYKYRLVTQGLAESERRFKAIFDASPVPFALNDHQGNITLLNPAFINTYGYTPNDIPTLSDWWPKAYPDAGYRQWAIETWQALIARTQHNQAFETMEANIRCKNGEVRTVQAGAVPLDGSMVGSHLVTLLDVTEGKRHEQALAESVSVLQATLEATADGIMVTNLQGRIRSFNQRFLELWRIPADLIRQGDEGGRLQTLVCAQLKEPDQYLNRIYELYAHPDIESYDMLEFNDGKLVERYSLPQRIDNNITGRVWSFRDITERRRIEKQLLWRTAFLEALLESSPDGIVTVDNDGHKIQQNQRIAQMWNLPPEIADQTEDAKQIEFTKNQTQDPRQFVERIQYLYAHPDVTSHDEIELINGTILKRYSTSVWDWLGKHYGRIWQYRDVTAERRAERALQQKEYYQRALLDNIPHAIWLKDRDSRFLAVNQEFANVFSADTPEALVGKNDFDIALPDRAEGYRANDRRVMTTREKVSVEEIIIERGESKWFETYKAPVIDEEGQLLGTVGFARDISERKKTEENLRLAAMVYENSSEAMLVTDADNVILAANPAFTAMTGYSVDEVIGTTPNILRSGEHDEAFYQAMWQAINTTGAWRGEIKNRRKNGELYTEELTINTIRNADGQPQRRVALFSDITQRKQSEEQIWWQANFDPLTSLPNRRMFRDRLEMEIKKAHRMGQSFALLFIDLDRFKEVNDTLGHEMGDNLLKETAHRLQTCVRETDTVARLGGDEFTIILSELNEVEDCERIAKNLLQKLCSPFRLGDELAYISASIGITLYPTDSTDLGQLLKNADQAMYAAKNKGRNGYNFFTQALQESLKERAALLGDLRNALPDNQFRLYYQPIVELRTGNIRKAEALLRWNHPVHGLVAPAEFIALAEETGHIIDIGDWVFRTAARQVSRWRADLHPEFQISINESPLRFQSALHSPIQWFDHLDELRISGQSIAVEITEGLLMNASPTVLNHLLAFRDAGMQVAIDDFGSGYSSLSYLKKFDIDYLKIAPSFIQNLSDDSADLVLCEAIIIMAHKLGLKVIAEGVETQQQLDLLTSIGCDYGQGYLFSEPLPAELFEKKFGRDDGA
jgi:diguanylate cyclase (GGDEF)-like protein/PAS domain S-box-containing protein